MEYKYNLHQEIKHKKTGIKGQIIDLVLTDNGKGPAYRILKNDGSYTKWSEGSIENVEEEQVPAKTEKPVLKIGDKVQLQDKDWMEKHHQWFKKYYLPRGWGTDEEACELIYGSIQQVTKVNNSTGKFDFKLKYDGAEKHFTIEQKCIKYIITSDEGKVPSQHKFLLGNIVKKKGDKRPFGIVDGFASAPGRFYIKHESRIFDDSEFDLYPHEVKPDTHKYKIGDRVYRVTSDKRRIIATILGYKYSSSGKKKPFYYIGNMKTPYSPGGWNEEYIKGTVNEPTKEKNQIKYPKSWEDIKEGDTLYIPKFDVIKAHFPGSGANPKVRPVWMPSMKEDCGKIVTVKKDVKSENAGVYFEGVKYAWDTRIFTDIKTKKEEEMEYRYFTQNDDLSRFFKKGDKVTILTKEELIGKGIKIKKDGNPVVCIGWDSTRKMQKLMGTEVEIERVYEDKITTEEWTFSYECIKQKVKGETEPENDWGEIPTAEEVEYFLDISTIKSSSGQDRIQDIIDVFNSITKEQLEDEDNEHIAAIDVNRYRFLKAGHSETLPSDATGRRYRSNTQKKFLDLFRGQKTATASSVDDWDIPVKAAKKKEEKVYVEPDLDKEIKDMLPVYPVLLEGPVGSGKTTTAMKICEDLGLEFLSDTITRQTTVSMLLGYKTVTGDTVTSKLRDAYENGKFYLLEELNGGDPNVLLCLNTMENGFLAFPDKIVYAHPDFRMMATMNDITNSKDFGGRSLLDLSTLNRYHRIYVPQKLDTRFSKQTLNIVKGIDEQLSKQGVTSLVTTRDVMRFEHMCKTEDPVIAAHKCLVNNKIKIEFKAIQKIIDDSQDWE